MHEDPEFVEAMLGAGASGYVLKDSAHEELATALRTVDAGGTYLSPDGPAHGGRWRNLPQPRTSLSGRHAAHMRDRPSYAHGLLDPFSLGLAGLPMAPLGAGGPGRPARGTSMPTAQVYRLTLSRPTPARCRGTAAASRRGQVPGSARVSFCPGLRGGGLHVHRGRRAYRHKRGGVHSRPVRSRVGRSRSVASGSVSPGIR
jgi:hypothetical protein